MQINFKDNISFKDFISFLDEFNICNYRIIREDENDFCIQLSGLQAQLLELKLEHKREVTKITKELLEKHQELVRNLSFSLN